MLFLLALLVVLLGNIISYNLNNQNFLKNEISPKKDFEKDLGLKTAYQDPMGSPLLVTQYATISNTFFPLSLPTNVSFTLAENWNSKNVSIYYNGVSHKKNWIINGIFGTGQAPWQFFTSDPTAIDNLTWQPSYVELETQKNKPLSKGAYGYYEENFTIPEHLASNSIVTLSMDYKHTLEVGGTVSNDNMSAFISLDAGGIQKNVSIPLRELNQNYWTEMSLTYDLSDIGQQLPNNFTVRAGIYVFNDTTTGAKKNFLSLDNIQFQVWTAPNQKNLLVAKDFEFNSEYPYQNITFGQGKTFIDKERNSTINRQVKFMISRNSTITDEFFIKNITIVSNMFKLFNSTISGLESSMYTTNNRIDWQTDCSFVIPYGYTDNWAEIMKPSDWNITSILDGYNSEQKDSCTGYEFGSGTLVIPQGVLSSGLWTISAVSPNYISEGSLNVYNGTAFEIKSSITVGDTFQINVSLDGSAPYQNTFINCSIEYPNGSLFYQSSEQLTSHDLEFGSFIVGNNMPVGSYNVILLWTNNQSYAYRDKVGYLQFNFNLWHHANLTPVESYIESVSGEPLLIKVNYTDYDLDTFIDFATVTYNSTLGISGTMIYFGSGIYVADIDTSGIGNGDYFFSFNASKTFYENQSTNNLIHLKITPQALKLIFSSRVINSTGNAYAICKVNLEGEISGEPLSPANFSTDWDNGYSISDFSNGTYNLNFSTNGLPLKGVIETFEVGISVNKTNYRDVSDSITLIVHPIATVAEANRSNIASFINEKFEVKVNYTVEQNGALISGGQCTVQWDSNYDINPVADGFIITYYTTNLNIDAYNSLITLSKPGYEDALVNIVAIINEQDVTMFLSINGNNVTQNEPIELSFEQSINVSAQVYADREHAFLSGGILTMMGDHYQENLTETQPASYNLNVTIDGKYFDAGLSTIYLRFEKQNYTTTVFSFQFYIRAQNVNLTVRIDNELIQESHLIEKFSHENITISCRAFAEIEAIYLTGGSVVLITDLNQISLSENTISWYNKTFTISSDLLSQGINYVYLKFSLTNYTTTTFSFQIYVRAQPIILQVMINHQNYLENHLLPIEFNKNVSISCKAFADVEKVYLSGGNITLFIDSYEIPLSEYANFWYNGSFIISTDLFSLGFNSIYLQFDHANYTTSTFTIQLQVNQIPINVHTVNFASSVEIYSGYTKSISVNLTELNSDKPIENATITCYSQVFGQFSFVWEGGGIYNLTLGPITTLGTYQFKLIITPKENLYKVAEYPFDLIISEKPVQPGPNYLLLIIILSLISVVGVLGVLSMRSYVILPRRRRKRQIIAEKTQGYKDIRNIEALIISSKQSGMTLYNKTFSILDEDYITGFSGFIQAITILGKQYTKEGVKVESVDELEKDANEIKELDFNFFHSLICDYKQIRLILLLREKSSERLRKEIEHLAKDLYSECEDLIVGFMGNLKALKTPFEDVIDRHLAFYYKGPFTLNKNEKYQSLKLSGDLSKLEVRILNVLESQAKYNKQFYLSDLFTSLLQNVDQDSLIVAIESLIAHELIIPQSQKYSLYLN